jgi:hypothetical protein
MLKPDSADMVLINANALTMDKHNAKAEAIAVKDGKFMQIGTTEEVKQLITNETEVKDLEGMTVTPGFNDAHNHILQFGMIERSINLRESSTSSIKDILNTIKKQTELQKKESWVIVEGYNQNTLEEKRHITRWELDQVAPEHIVCIRHVNMNMYVLNSKLLAMMDIKKDTPDLEDAEIVKDKVTGEPTGLINAHPSCARLNNLMPKATYKELLQTLEWANQLFLSQGITSATDAGVGMSEFPREIGAYQEAIENGIFKVRLNLGIWSRAFLDFDKLDEDLSYIEHNLFKFGIRSGLGNEKLRIGPFKIVTDGPLSGGGTATYEPYGVDPNNQSTGVMAIEGNNLRNLVSAVHSLGWQVAVHAIGDRAIDNVLSAYEASLQQKPKIDHRCRIEHVYMPSSDAMEKAKELRVLYVVQPGFIWELGDSFIMHLGEKKAAKTFPFRTLFDKGVFVAFSSDRPVTSIVSGAPLLGMHTAVNQKTMSGQDYAPEEKISIEEALRCYTINGAYTTFEENIKGSIEVGKLADMVILGEDPTKVPSEHIKDIPVVATIINGEFVYEK